MRPAIEKPELQNRTLEPTGHAQPGKTRRLTRTGPGLARLDSAGQVSGRFWNWTDPFFRAKPGPLAGYQNLLLTLPAGVPLPHWMVVMVRNGYSCHNDLCMHLWVLSIGVTWWSSDNAPVPSAARLTICIFIERLRSIIHTISWCSKACDCNKDEYDRQNASWLWKPKNQCCENTAPSLLQTCAEVSAPPKFDYPISQLSEHPECTSITAGAFRSTCECSCRVWERFA